MYNVWLSYTIWSVAERSNVHGILGPDLPDGNKPSTGLATGHPVLGNVDRAGVNPRFVLGQIERPMGLPICPERSVRL